MRRLLGFSIILFLAAGTLFLVTEIRRIRKEDSSAPVITMESGSIEVSISDPEEALLAGVTASDRRDGDVTSSVVVEKISNFLRENTRLVTYAAFDSDLHVTHETREVTYTDYAPPEFSAKSPFSYKTYTYAVLDDVGAWDCLDGDLSSRIRILSDTAINTGMPGEYEASLQVANSAGDVASLPVILQFGAAQGTPSVLLTDYILYLDPGASFDPASLIRGVQIGDSVYEVRSGRGNYGSRDRQNGEAVYVGLQDISIEGMPDTSVPGSCTVVYSYTADAGDAGPVTGKTRLYVVVRKEPRPEAADRGRQ